MRARAATRGTLEAARGGRSILVDDTPRR